MKIAVSELAHVRASACAGGAALAVFAAGRSEYAILARELTVSRVRAALGPGAPPLAARHELPRLGCLIFQLAIPEDPAWTLRLEGGRQNWAARLLDLEIDKGPPLS
jgi:hypothetical protein